MKDLVLRNWEARRSGASITVPGIDPAGGKRRLSGINAISTCNGRIIADTDDAEIVLVLSDEHAEPSSTAPASQAA